MPENFLSSYLTASFDKEHKSAMKGGLVVTISREKGCGAFPISKMIIQKLNELKYPLGRVIKWKLISKEILEQSAEQLKMDPSKVDSLIDMHLVQELLFSFTEKTLPSDIKIKNTIRKVIQNAANEGNVIIIGRGGVSITRHMENSLHIQLVAPFEWRVRQIASQENISLPKADQLVRDRDRQRENLKKYYLGSRRDDIHIYDLIFNVSTMTQAEVAGAIFSIIKSRQDELILH